MTEKKKQGPSQATRLTQIAFGADIDLFHTAAQETFAMVPVDGHIETWPLKGGAFRRWLQHRYYEQARTTPGSQATQDALGVLEGHALFDGEEHDVHLRLAEHEGAIYVDLADDAWRAVRVDRDGWQVVDDPPVRFRRAVGMLPLPAPGRGDEGVDELRPFVNVTDDDWPLLCGYLVSVLRPTGPYGVLLVHGEQGSAKSTAIRVVRELVDPNEAPIRREPPDGRDLVLAARNGWIIAYDNVSYLPNWLSDDLSRLSTGMGFATRQLYENLDEVLVSVQRPIALNGIADVVTRGDLLDRAIVLYLPALEEYRPEAEFWDAFEKARPRILGALLDGVVGALNRVDDVEVGHLRMVDFARWAVAAEPALGLEEGSFLAAYERNRADAVGITLESSPVVAPLQELANAGAFEGTAGSLLARLAIAAGEDEVRRKGWPGGPHVLSGQLRRLAPALRRVGVEVEFVRRGGTRLIKVEKASAVAPDGAVNGGTRPGDPGYPLAIARLLQDGAITAEEHDAALAEHEGVTS